MEVQRYIDSPAPPLQILQDHLVKSGLRCSAVVPEVIFRYKEYSNRVKKTRDVLLISIPDIPTGAHQRYLDIYLRHLPASTISFPLKENADHLKVRVGDQTYSHTYPWIRQLPQFNRETYSFPNSRRMDVMIQLSQQEHESVKTYIANVEKSRRRTLGRFTDEGSQYTVGTLASNRAIKGGHNCTSWISTAPIGARKEAMLELFGGSRSHEIGTNPGWWGSWLVSSAPKERIPFITVFTNQSLKNALANEVISGQPLVWNYGRK